jgi:dUTP pyrophosphatase
MKLKVWTKKVAPMVGVDQVEAILPVRATAKAAGYDISTPYPIEIKPGEQAFIDTGLIFGLPEDYCIEVVPRSGLSTKNRITIPNSPGTLDADYCGPNDTLKVCLRNDGGRTLSLSRGDRIAQIKVVHVEPLEFDVQEDLPSMDDRGGFGSTGGIAAWKV